MKESQLEREPEKETPAGVKLGALEPEKRTLFEKSPAFAELLKKAEDERPEDVIDLVFSTIRLERTAREIDAKEFSLIARLARNKSSELWSKKALLLHSEEQKRVLIFHSGKNDEEPLRLKRLLEKTFFFEPESQLSFLSQIRMEGPLQWARDAVLAKLNAALSRSSKKPKLAALEQEPTVFTLKRFDEAVLAELREALQRSYVEDYLFTLVFDPAEKTCREIASSLEKRIKEENWEFSFKMEKVQNPELFLDAKPKNQLFSLFFFGKGANIFNYFKTKPKTLFITESFYIFCARNDNVDRTIAKLLHEQYLTLNSAKTYSFDRSLFIDLCDKNASNRFPFPSSPSNYLLLPEKSYPEQS